MDITHERALSRPVSGAAVVIGSFICMSLIVLFGLLSGGLGTAGDDFNVGLFVTTLVLAVIIPFFIGGWLTARSAAGLAPYLHAASMWAIVTVFSFFAIISQATSFAGGVIGNLGLQNVRMQASSPMGQGSMLQPSCVTEIDMESGTSVTSLVMDDEPHPMAAAEGRFPASVGQDPTQQSQIEGRQIPQETQEQIHQGVERSSWGAFAAVLIALGSSLSGARLQQARMRREKT